MALTSFCSVCRRTVYLNEADTTVCPVCSSPLLETVEPPEETSEEEEKAQAEGLK
jgi:predicted amidophosphoribosyltransferase